MTSGLALPRGRGDTLLAQRFGSERRSAALWVFLWVLAAAATFGALAPVLFRHVPFEPIDVAFRIVGASFVACGLVAWRRRPDNRSGLLMTATGFALFASPLLAQIDAPLTQTLGLLLPDLWVLFFVPLVLTLLTGGRMRTLSDRLLVAVVLVDLLVLAPLWLMFAPAEGNMLLIQDDPRLAGVVNTVQLVLFVAIPVGTALVLAVRWWRASTPGRRALLPGVAGAGCLLLFAVMLVVQLVTGVKSQALLWIGACSLITVPIAFLAGLLRSRLARAGVADLFRDLRSIGPVELQATLARVLGDPQLAARLPARRRPRRRRRPSGRPRRRRRRSGGHAGRPRRRARRRADLRPVAGGRPRARRGDRGGGRGRAGEPPAARRGDGAARRAAGLPRAHRDGRRRRAAPHRAQPARRRPAAAGHARAAALADPARDPAATRRRPSSWSSSASDELALSLEELRELARGIHPAALEHGLDVALDALAAAGGGADDGRRRRRAAAARAGGVRGVLRGVGGAGQRGQARPRVGGDDQPAAQRATRSSSRSPTTASAARTSRGAPACRVSPTGWKPSAAGSR